MSGDTPYHSIRGNVCFLRHLWYTREIQEILSRAQGVLTGAFWAFFCLR